MKRRSLNLWFISYTKLQITLLCKGCSFELSLAISETICVHNANEPDSPKPFFSRVLHIFRPESHIIQTLRTYIKKICFPVNRWNVGSFVHLYPDSNCNKIKVHYHLKARRCLKLELLIRQVVHKLTVDKISIFEPRLPGT